MNRLAIAGGLLGGSLLLFSGITLGHGGVYRGPGDTVQPGGASPGPGTPGPSGPSTPGPQGPSGPNQPAPGGPTTPPPGGGGTPTPAGGPVTGPMASGPNLESWTFWWAFNRERFLQLKAHIAKDSGVVTGSSGDEFLGGQGAGKDTLRPSKDLVVSKVLPALKAALEKETNKDIVTGALVALAKIGEDPDGCLEIFKKFLTSGEYEVNETAVISMGILAAPQGIEIMHQIFLDSEEARKLLGKKEVPWRQRTFAAYGLGLVAARQTDVELRAKVQGYLLDFLAKEGAKRAPNRDLRVATIVSLGLIPDPDRKAVPALEAYMAENRKKEEIICAHIPNAIARLLNGAPVNERQRYADVLIADLAEKPKSPEQHLRPSLPQSIGMLTHADDPFAKKAIDVICDKIDKELAKNVHVAYFGIMALGEISGTDKPGNAIEKYLLEKAQQKGGRVMTRAWAALGLGVGGFDQIAKNQKPSEVVGTALVDMMREIKDPEQLGAFALGVGLIKFTPGASQLLKCLDEVKSDDFRGYFATALGLMDEKSAIPKITEIVKNATRRPELLRECSIALGLLGDKKVGKMLIDIMRVKENKALAVQAAVATALGYIGDYQAVQPLIEMLADEKKELTAESRAFAGVALGIVCDKEEYPWNYKISADLNYMSTTETLNDQGSQTGVLNLL